MAEGVASEHAATESAAARQTAMEQAAAEQAAEEAVEAMAAMAKAAAGRLAASEQATIARVAAAVVTAAVTAAQREVSTDGEGAPKEDAAIAVGEMAAAELGPVLEELAATHAQIAQRRRAWTIWQSGDSATDARVAHRSHVVGLHLLRRRLLLVFAALRRATVSALSLHLAGLRLDHTRRRAGFRAFVCAGERATLMWHLQLEASISRRGAFFAALAATAVTSTMVAAARHTADAWRKRRLLAVVMRR